MRSLGVSLTIMLTLISAGLAQEGQYGRYNSIARACNALLAETNTDMFSQGFCMGMVRGIIYSSVNVCPPSGANLIQAVRVVVNYADKIPERWHEPEAKIAAEALARAWPCRR